MMKATPALPILPRSLSRALIEAAALFALLTSPATSDSQTQPAASALNNAPQQPSTIRVTTRLIEVTLVVQGKNGKPIAGLQKQDFTLLDEGQPQQIAFFSATATPHLPRRPLPPHFFTNRSELKGEDPGAITVILFDALNTAWEDQSLARQHVLRFLKTVKPQDHVAIFALTTELLPLHDFTQDSAALAESMSRFSPRLLAAFDASHPEDFHVAALANDPLFQRFQNRVNEANGEIADAYVFNRFSTTYAALVAIANYVAPIPGHKSLVWVSGGIPIQLGLDRIGVPDRDDFRFDNSSPPGTAANAGMSGLARILNRANIAIYPIDAHGIDVDDSPSAFFSRQDQRDTFRLLADRTGGKAFYGTNDISGAMDAAFEDGRYVYTLGFYPNHGVWDGKFRQLNVKVHLEGAQLRYRRGYYAFPDRANDDTSMKIDLQEAARSPLDATSLGLNVKSKALPRSTPELVQLQIILDPKQFLLQEADQRRRGGLDLLFVQKGSSGDFLAAEKQHFDVNFSPREYEFLAKVGLILQRRLSIDPASAELRVLVRDTGSGSLGSVTIPVQKLLH